MCSAVHYQPKQPKTLLVLNRGGAGETEADLCIKLNRQLILFQTHRLVAGTQASEPNTIKPDPDLLEGVRVHLRLGTCYILVLAELRCICGAEWRQRQLEVERGKGGRTMTEG